MKKNLADHQSDHQCHKKLVKYSSARKKTSSNYTLRYKNYSLLPDYLSDQAKPINQSLSTSTRNKSISSATILMSNVEQMNFFSINNKLRNCA